METVVIRSALLGMDEKETVVEMSMFDVDRQILKALLWTNFVHFNLHTQKTETHSEHLRATFATYEHVEVLARGFEARVEELKNNTDLKIT